MLTHHKVLISKAKIEKGDFQSIDATVLGFTNEFLKKYYVHNTQFQIDGEYLVIFSTVESREIKHSPYIGMI